MYRWTSLAAALLAALTACGRPEGSVADTRSVTISSDLPPGATCQYGGQQILTGVDLNGNGVLEASEVLQVVNVCADQPTGGCSTLTYEYYVSTAEDWKHLADLGCTRIGGTLTIAATGVAGFEQELPLVQAGGLRVIQTDALTSLRLPHLTTLDGGVEVTENTLLAALDLPALTTVGGKLLADTCLLYTSPSPRD